MAFFEKPYPYNEILVTHIQEYTLIVEDEVHDMWHTIAGMKGMSEGNIYFPKICRKRLQSSYQLAAQLFLGEDSTISLCDAHHFTLTVSTLWHFVWGHNDSSQDSSVTTKFKLKLKKKRFVNVFLFDNLDCIRKPRGKKKQALHIAYTLSKEF